jgi:3D (Asp-Asp-Asp) domain-containing protein/LysM repeat protein
LLAALLLPAGALAQTKTAVSYTVKHGDSLWRIATRHYGNGAVYAKIAQVNGIKNPNLIFPGQLLVLPDANPTNRLSQNKTQPVSFKPKTAASAQSQVSALSTQKLGPIGSAAVNDTADLPHGPKSSGNLAGSIKSQNSITAEPNLKNRVNLNARSMPVHKHNPIQRIAMLVTGYCPCDICSGYWKNGQLIKRADGYTANGRNAYKTAGVAADNTLLPIGTTLQVPGVGILQVDDTGGDMRKNAARGVYHIDIRFPTHQQAAAFGKRFIKVGVLKALN